MMAVNACYPNREGEESLNEENLRHERKSLKKTDERQAIGAGQKSGLPLHEGAIGLRGSSQVTTSSNNLKQQPQATTIS